MAISPMLDSFKPVSRRGAELLFQVFTDRYERSSLLITSNLGFAKWVQVFQGERMAAALLDRFTTSQAGRDVGQGILKAGQRTALWNASGAVSGIYLVKMETPPFSASR